MLGKAIFSRLTTAQTGDVSAQTTALATVAATVADRIYPNESPDNLYPMIVYEIRQESEDSITPMTAKEFSVTLTMAATGSGAYSTVQTLKAAVRTLLDRKTSPNTGWGGVVARFFLDGSDESQENDGSNPDASYFEVVDEYRVWAQA